MPKRDQLAAFAAALRGFDSYVITGHVNPDPDCLGTMLALGWGLTSLGKQVTLVSPDPVPDSLLFMPGAATIATPPAPTADVLLVVDCELERTGAVAEQRDDFAHVYNVDHHVTNKGTGSNYYVDAEAAATGEIVTSLLIDHWGLTLDSDVAANLYTAIMTDTGSFRYDNTTAATLRIAARLIEAGARPGTIAAAVYEHMSWSAFQLLRSSLNTLSRSADGRIAWMMLTQEMLRQSDATDDDSAGLSQYPRMIAGVDVGLLLRETSEDETRISLRSRGAVDVSAIAARFGGGGHAGAAGCTIAAGADEALKQLLDAASEALAAGNDG